MNDTTYQVLLYYKYVPIPNPSQMMRDQRELCGKLGLKGRIIIATEGINGTVEGTVEKTEQYIEEMRNNSLFKDLVFKRSAGTGNAFPKLSVRVRDEIVTTGVSDLNPTKTTGKYITSEELHEWIASKKEFYIVDMRNDYEYASGYFENSLFSGLRNFYDLPKVLPALSHLKDKTVVTVCTGGVRCEKASGFLLLNGFKDVYQLKDGIHTYMEKYPNEHFKGKLYVFDSRLTLGFNTDDPKHEIVGRCMHCEIACDSYVNCEYDECHRHYICCDNCLDVATGLAFCNSDCKRSYELIMKRRGKAIPYK